MATTGTYISAAGHTGLIIWLIAGWGFASEPLPFEVSDVSVVSSEEYAAIVAATTPTPGNAAPDAPAAPAEETPPAEELPPPEPPLPVPPVEDVTDTPPDLAPQPLPEQPAIPEPVTDARPQPRPATRVAPEPVAPPPPDTEVAEVPQEATTPDEPAPEAVPEEPVEQAAPEEAATEIVTEADTPSGAVETSLRPQVRPERPAPQPPVETAETPEAPATPAAPAEETAVDDAAVAAALADALAASESPAVPAGPPMTGSEREGFRVAVNACWNVDPGSEAARATITVGFTLDQSGRVQGDVRLLSADGGSDGAQSIAFQAARRAILRCQRDGYQLPADKYDQWREVEITFDPSGMRLR